MFLNTRISASLWHDFFHQQINFKWNMPNMHITETKKNIILLFYKKNIKC